MKLGFLIRMKAGYNSLKSVYTLTEYFIQQSNYLKKCFGVNELKAN